MFGFADITIVHDGTPTELTWSWDFMSNVLTLTGNLSGARTLSTITVLATPADTGITFEFQITVLAQMTFEDVKDAVLQGLQYYYFRVEITVVSESALQTTFTAQATLSYTDFEQKGNLAFELNHTMGTGASWNITNSYADIPLAAVTCIVGAKGRLIAADRLNAIYRSAVTDALDFNPSLETQAGVTTPQAITGNVVTLLEYPRGFFYLHYG
jgi:hypothetical protein